MSTKAGRAGSSRGNCSCSPASVSGGGIVDGASVSPVGSSGIGGGSSVGVVGVGHKALCPTPQW